MAKPQTPSGMLDPELTGMPEEIRWREWMGRVEAAIFASLEPVPREALARLVGKDCVLADIRDELKSRPCELVFIAGGFQHRTKPRFAEAIRAAATIPEHLKAPDLTKLEALVLAAVAYRQPVTRAALSEALGRDVSRVIPRRAADLRNDAGVPGAVRYELTQGAARSRGN